MQKTDGDNRDLSRILGILKRYRKGEMKQRYVKVTIEAPAYEAKAAAEQYSKDRKYEVLSRSKPYPCKESSNVKIYLHVIKKTQLGYKHEGGWKKAGKHGKQRKSPRINYEALMMPSY